MILWWSVIISHWSVLNIFEHDVPRGSHQQTTLRCRLFSSSQVPRFPPWPQSLPPDHGTIWNKRTCAEFIHVEHLCLPLYPFLVSWKGQMWHPMLSISFHIFPYLSISFHPLALDIVNSANSAWRCSIRKSMGKPTKAECFMISSCEETPGAMARSETLDSSDRSLPSGDRSPETPPAWRGGHRSPEISWNLLKSPEISWCPDHIRYIYIYILISDVFSTPVLVILEVTNHLWQKSSRRDRRGGNRPPPLFLVWELHAQKWCPLSSQTISILWR